MTEILPCPNPECRGECEVRHEDLTDTPWGMMRNYWVECWKAGGEESCLYRGPVDQSAPIAIEKHNAMPREAEWVSVESATALPSGNARYDIARVRALAKEQAGHFFALDQQLDEPSLSVDRAWPALNREFPGDDDATAEHDIELLFERAYRHEMAKRWAEHTAEETEPVPRRPIQIAHHAGVTVALCNDGTIMQWKSGQTWQMLPEVPQWEPAP